MTRELGSAFFVVVATLIAAAAAQPQEAPSPAAASETCDRCHGEVEFLRQHVDRLDQARALHVSSGDIARSAHAGESCASCHTGFERWPHTGAVETATCGSCHEEAGTLWSVGMHAAVDDAGAEAATCAACHGLHLVGAADDLIEGPGMDAMNFACVACHETSDLPPADPHAGAVSCASCHAAHDLRGVDDPDAAAAPLRQRTTCGACHEEVAEAHASDAHGVALAEAYRESPPSLAQLALVQAESPPTCTSCHGTHGMIAAADTAWASEAVARCSTCHEDLAQRYFGTYHGKATALGSHIVATCDDCHSAHEIYPTSDPASWVHAERVVETCAACHEEARPAFVAYDSHPDPMDRSRNAPLFYAFVFMNTLLFSVLAVFGLHTLLWWVRILLDQRKAAAGGGGHV